MDKINYRKDQIPIINYDKGTMAVPAVPGAGKTFIITNLVAKLLLEKKNNNKKILILTFMNSAVNNFKGRIKKILEENEIKNKSVCEVMTIHSLAIKIIKEKPEVVMLGDEFNVADDLQKNIILNECITKYRKSGGERVFSWFLKEQRDDKWRNIAFENWQNGFFDVISKAISDLKYKNISPDKLEELIQGEYKGMLRMVYPIYKEYEKKLKQNGLLDYDDMLILAHKALCLDEGLRNKFQNKYEYIFEDECQDSNEIQGKIIKLISNDKNLVRVGDINQSINGTFSSSDPKFFKEFIEDADVCYRMNMSNRSSKDVLDLANKLVKYVTKDFKQIECRQALEDMEIETVPTNKGYKENPTPERYTINAKAYITWQDEVRESIRFVKGIKKNYPEKTIGILAPFNFQIEEIAQELDSNDMVYEELGPNSKYKRKVIDNISVIIDFILSCNDIESLINVLDKVFISSENKDEKINFLNLLRNYTTEDLIYSNISEFTIVDIDDKSYSQYLKGIEILKDIIEYPITKLDSLILFIAEKLELEKEDKTIADYIAFYIKYLSMDNLYLDLERVNQILKESRNNVFKYITEIAYEVDGYEPDPGSITICNYHKSKGLEWDCVFLLGLTQFNFPDNINDKFQGERWYLKDKYKNPTAVIKNEIDKITGNCNSENYINNEKIEIINEKIRLLYVGITRAKEMLILSYSKYRDENDVNKKNKEQSKSLYLEILETYIRGKREG